MNIVVYFISPMLLVTICKKPCSKIIHGSPAILRSLSTCKSTEKIHPSRKLESCLSLLWECSLVKLSSYFKFSLSNMTQSGSLDLDPGSHGRPMNSWCVSFETECSSRWSALQKGSSFWVSCIPPPWNKFFWGQNIYIHVDVLCGRKSFCSVSGATEPPQPTPGV